MGSSQAACWDPGTVAHTVTVVNVHTVTVVHMGTPASPMSGKPLSLSQVAYGDPDTDAYTARVINTECILYIIHSCSFQHNKSAKREADIGTLLYTCASSAPVSGWLAMELKQLSAPARS
jgi:hypothetical protein